MLVTIKIEIWAKIGNWEQIGMKRRWNRWKIKYPKEPQKGFRLRVSILNKEKIFSIVFTTILLTLRRSTSIRKTQLLNPKLERNGRFLSKNLKALKTNMLLIDLSLKKTIKTKEVALLTNFPWTKTTVCQNGEEYISTSQVPNNQKGCQSTKAHLNTK